MNHHTAKITLSPVDDILYAVEIPDEMTEFTQNEECLTLDGIRHLIKQCKVALVLEMKQDDF